MEDITLAVNLGKLTIRAKAASQNKEISVDDALLEELDFRRIKYPDIQSSFMYTLSGHTALSPS